MPAHKTQTIDNQEAYCHIYNRGVEKRIIFSEEQDYDTFLKFLKEYLNSPIDQESVKKEFSVKGRTYRGIPHQPKNYLNKVELIAYTMIPDHFHLLLREIEKGAIEGFMRSLSTRYSIYFNKKYHRSGSLFEGPYKSVNVTNKASLALLIRHFHREQPTSYSSYPEYLGKRTTQWVRLDNTLSFSDPDEYKNFVEKYEPNEQEKLLLERITIEKTPEQIANNSTSQILTKNPDDSASQQTQKYLQPSERSPELFAISFVFMLLIGSGVRNITASAQHYSTGVSPTPQVAGESAPATPTTTYAPTLRSEPATELVVTIGDGSDFVNIRKEPTVTSEKIGQAVDGDRFSEFILTDPEWYQITLPDGSTGFISAKYTEVSDKKS
ncbi:SH3 domain-containing protein [Candidatus Roizmanbacteria bacterium]|nr:SH3 domain-containing protein [Candidatus Roizmanbacteria bacterium]